jgi:hypothetical protein
VDGEYNTYGDVRNAYKTQWKYLKVRDAVGDMD